MICFCLFPIQVNGQSGKLFSTDNDLTSSLINQIYQDSQGNIWIATENGLNCYDGVKFRQFKNIKNDSTSILHNYVRLLFEDKQNRLYLGYFNGLQVYDYNSQNFIEVPLYTAQNKKIETYVSTMIHRNNGDILIGSSGNGIFKLTEEHGKLVGRELKQLVPSAFISDLFEDSKNNLWVVTRQMSIFKIDSDNKLHSYNSENENNGGAITSICEDTNGNIYLGKLNDGVYKLDTTTKSFRYINYKNHSILSVMTLITTRSGELLIGTDGKGVKRYNTAKGIIEDTSFDVSQFTMSRAKAHTIIEDHSGNLWMGVYQKGLLFIPDKSNNFKYIGYRSINTNVIGTSCISALFKDHNGILWVGTDGEGVYGLDADFKQIVHFEHPKATSIMSIYEDSQHTLWVGTYANGLAKINTNTGKFTFPENMPNQAYNKIEHVYGISEDSNANLLIGTLGFGLYSLNLNSGKFQNVNTFKKGYPKDTSDILGDNFISCMYKHNNLLYIGTYHGLSCLNLDSKSYLNFNGKNRVLPDKIIYSVFVDSENTLWLGTSEGLYSKTTKATDFSHYTVKNGLPNNSICAIEEDDSGRIWLSTHHGISSFDKANKVFSNYFFNDGLQGNEFWRKSSYSDQGKQLFFGGINGITHFAPNEITNPIKHPEIKFTAAYLNNNEINTNSKSGSYQVVNTNISDVDSLHLSYNDNFLTFEFTTTSFIESEQLTYYYKLNNNNWVGLRPGSNSLTLSELSPGIYKLAIKAKEFDKFSNAKSLVIYIHPPWYATLWAKLIYAFVIIAILLFTSIQIWIRVNKNKRIHEQQVQNQIKDAKLQFFVNISHEIKTPISLIINPLKKLMDTDTNEIRQESYTIMKRNCDRILRLMYQLMDMRKLDEGQLKLSFEKTDIVAHTREICLLFEDQKNLKQIDFEFQQELPEMYAEVDQDNFDKIIQNILANAYKFTPINGQIKLTLAYCIEKTTKYIKIAITDSGAGINQEDEALIFDKFYQSSTQNTSFEGAGIGLHLTKSIVEMHHGLIEVHNNTTGKGCTFTVKLPVYQEQNKESNSSINKKTEPIKQETIIVTEPAVETSNQATIIKSKYNIMVVDDSTEIREYLTQELSNNYHIIQAENGKEALSKLLHNAADLVISDIKMPLMDGITLCRKIKNHVNINHIPVILLTAKSGDDINIKGLETGADAFLAKPFNMDILKKTIKNILQNRELLKHNFGGSQITEDMLDTIEVKSADEKLLDKVTSIINDNIGNPDLNVEMLATEIGISRVHLYRKLKELTNQSAGELIKNIRLKQAGTLLSEKKLNISEVTYATGFPNVSTFSTRFKNFYGVSPKEYRDNNLSKNNSLQNHEK